MADRMRMFFNLEQHALFLKIFHDLLAAFKTVHAFILKGIVIHRAVFIHDENAFKVVAVSDFKVVRIMGRRNFDGA